MVTITEVTKTTASSTKTTPIARAASPISETDLQSRVDSENRIATMIKTAGYTSPDTNAQQALVRFLAKFTEENGYNGSNIKRIQHVYTGTLSAFQDRLIEDNNPAQKLLSRERLEHAIENFDSIFTTYVADEANINRTSQRIAEQENPIPQIGNQLTDDHLGKVFNHLNANCPEITILPIDPLVRPSDLEAQVKAELSKGKKLVFSPINQGNYHWVYRVYGKTGNPPTTFTSPEISYVGRGNVCGDGVIANMLQNIASQIPNRTAAVNTLLDIYKPAILPKKSEKLPNIYNDSVLRSATQQVIQLIDPNTAQKQQKKDTQKATKKAASASKPATENTAQPTITTIPAIATTSSPDAPLETSVATKDSFTTPTPAVASISTGQTKNFTEFSNIEEEKKQVLKNNFQKYFNGCTLKFENDKLEVWPPATPTTTTPTPAAPVFVCEQTIDATSGALKALNFNIGNENKDKSKLIGAVVATIEATIKDKDCPLEINEKSWASLGITADELQKALTKANFNNVNKKTSVQTWATSAPPAPAASTAAPSSTSATSSTSASSSSSTSTTSTAASVATTSSSLFSTTPALSSTTTAEQGGITRLSNVG